MGIRREVYMALGGFGKMRFGEDVDFSLRIVEAGYKTALIEDAFVYHKRRTDLKKFWRQVYNSGIARINLHLLHPGSLKIVHTLPAVFTIGVVLLFLGGAVFCLFSDLIARTFFAPTELSISTVTAVFGAPCVIWIMMTRNKRPT